jgi:hypothetical protein
MGHDVDDDNDTDDTVDGLGTRTLSAVFQNKVQGKAEP